MGVLPKYSHAMIAIGGTDHWPRGTPTVGGANIRNEDFIKRRESDDLSLGSSVSLLCADSTTAICVLPFKYCSACRVQWQQVERA